MKEFIKHLPKAELHLHIEGTLEPEMLFSLAKKNNINIPYKSIEDVKQAYNFTNLQSFLDIYYAGAAVLQTQEDFFDLTWAYLLKCKDENILHTEIFFDPQTHTARGISFETVIMGIHKALSEAKEKLGISAYLIMCFLRHLSQEDAIDTLSASLPFKHFIKGVGLDSSELGNPPQKFEKVFAMAKAEGYLLVAHAGEEGDSSYIEGALDILEVNRIDHGVRSSDSQALMQRLKQEQMPLTVCPLSNIKLKVFHNMAEHNLKTLLDYGLNVTINSDDPSYFGGYLNANFLESATALKLSKQELITLAKNSFNASFLDTKTKQYYLHLIEEYAQKISI